MKTFFIIYWLPAFIPFLMESFSWRKIYKNASKEFFYMYQRAEIKTFVVIIIFGVLIYIPAIAGYIVSKFKK